MEFSEFKALINHLSKKPLGGIESQLELTPKIRHERLLEQIMSDNPKKAAVLTLFYPNAKNEVSILLTQRASYKGTHSAQISFPGGKFDSSDESLQMTALREANEEVGIISEDVSIFKEMTTVYIPPSNFIVSPFLGCISYRPTWKTNHEVDRIVEVTLDELLDESKVSSTELTTSYAEKMLVPCFQFKNAMVWGATAMMLSEIKAIFK